MSARKFRGEHSVTVLNKKVNSALTTTIKYNQHTSHSQIEVKEKPKCLINSLHQNFKASTKSKAMSSAMRSSIKINKMQL